MHIYQSIEYMENLYSRTFGWERLAILYSLPFAFLMWRCVHRRRALNFCQS